jgi:hypothetical protein
MSVRTTLLAASCFVALFVAASASTLAQNNCNWGSDPVSANIDTILYATSGPPDVPLMITANIDNGVGSVSTVFQQNGTGQINFTGVGRLVSATVNGTTVCYGSTGTTTLPSGATATIEVNTSATTGRPYIRVSVDELQ